MNKRDVILSGAKDLRLLWPCVSASARFTAEISNAARFA
jgi:hypothetical protein